MIKKLIHNKIRCLKCGDIIESLHVHDCRWCKCGNIAIDGELDYQKICFYENNSFEFLSEYEEIEE